MFGFSCSWFWLVISQELKSFLRDMLPISADKQKEYNNNNKQVKQLQLAHLLINRE